MGDAGANLEACQSDESQEGEGARGEDEGAFALLLLSLRCWFGGAKSGGKADVGGAFRAHCGID